MTKLSSIFFCISTIYIRTSIRFCGIDCLWNWEHEATNLCFFHQCLFENYEIPSLLLRLQHVKVRKRFFFLLPQLKSCIFYLSGRWNLCFFLFIRDCDHAWPDGFLVSCVCSGKVQNFMCSNHKLLVLQMILSCNIPLQLHCLAVYI